MSCRTVVGFFGPSQTGGSETRGEGDGGRRGGLGTVGGEGYSGRSVRGRNPGSVADGEGGPNDESL